MKWYGHFSYSVKSSILNDRGRFTDKLKRAALSLVSRNNLNPYKLYLHVPSDWNFLLLKKNNKSPLLYCYFYSSSYFFLLPFFSEFLSMKHDSDASVLSFNFFFRNSYYPLFWNNFKTVFYSFSRIFFRKLKFRGKGYYIYKNSRNTVALQFGYSHILRFYAFSVNVKFITKTTIFMFGVNRNNITNRGFSFFSLRPINIFTGKGIRFSRQIIYRKTGKVSSYR